MEWTKPEYKARRMAIDLAQKLLQPLWLVVLYKYPDECFELVYDPENDEYIEEATEYYINLKRDIYNIIYQHMNKAIKTAFETIGE